jgi:peptidoglycan/LPS O-acetylase OafA/YrhL
MNLRPLAAILGLGAFALAFLAIVALLTPHKAFAEPLFRATCFLTFAAVIIAAVIGFTEDDVRE